MNGASLGLHGSTVTYPYQDEDCLTKPSRLRFTPHLKAIIEANGPMKLLRHCYHLLIPGALELTLRRFLRKQEELKSVATRMELSDVVKMCNCSQFLAICSFDVSVLTKRILIALPTWQRKLQARHLLLAIHELAEDVPQVLGRDLRVALAAGPNPQGHNAELGELQKALASTVVNWRNQIRTIRTISAAHRDHDATLLLGTIDSIHVPSVRDLGIEIHQWCSRAIDFLGRASEEYNQRTIDDRRLAIALARSVDRQQKNVDVE